MKTLIYTACFIKDNPKYETLLWEWLISLRTLGNYRGEIVIFDYGMPKELIEKLKSFPLDPPRIILLPERNGQHTTNYRNTDVIPYLEEYKDYSFSMFDFDIWLQKDINEMFGNLEHIEGCYHGIEPGRTCRYRGPDDFEVISEYDEIQNQLGGFVYGGWYAGRYHPYLDKMRRMKESFDKGWRIHEWGTDQSLITYLIDPTKDNLDGLIYGCTKYFCKEENELLKCVTGHDYKYENEDVVGVHFNASSGLRQEDKYLNFRFKNRYPEIWKKYYPTDSNL